MITMISCGMSITAIINMVEAIRLTSPFAFYKYYNTYELMALVMIIVITNPSA